jgi:hypothetical protein
MAAISLSEDAFKHIEELPHTISAVNLPESNIAGVFVLLSGDRLYT